MSKPFRDMTDDELRSEYLRWDKEVREYPCWGAGLVQADKWRAACATILAERGVDVPASDELLAAWAKYRPDDLTDDELAEYVIQSKGVSAP